MNKQYVHRRISILLVTVMWSLTNGNALSSVRIDSLKAVLTNSESDTSQINALNAIATFFTEENKTIDSALIYATKAYQQSIEKGFTRGQAISAYNIAYAYDFKGELKNALEYYELARIHYSNLTDHNNTHTAINGKGVACYFKGEYADALKYFLEASSFAKSHGLLKEEANSLSNIGVIYRITEKHTEAIDLFNQNIVLRKQLKDSVNLAKVYNNLGVVYTFIDSLNDAITFLDSSKLIYQALRDTVMISVVNITIGDAYLENGDLSLARNHLESGYSVVKENDDNVYQSKNLLYLGRLESLEGNHQKASDYLTKGLQILADTELDDIKKDILLALSQNSAKLNQHKRAYQYLRESTIISDSLKSEEKLKSMEELQAHYENAKKEKSIIDLQTQNEISTIKLESKRKTQVYLLLSLGILVALLSGLYSLYRRVSKQRTQIANNSKEKDALINNLEQAKNRMVNSDKMASIGQLTAGIAHEINNPINYISNNAKALKMDVEDLTPLLQLLLKIKNGDNSDKIGQELLETLDTIDLTTISEEIIMLINGIDNGAIRTSKIVSSLKYLSYSDKGVPEHMDIHEALNAAIAVIESSHDQDIIVHKYYNFQSKLKAYPGQINQLFVNIISNAYQSIGSQGMITITTSKDNEYCKICIEDNGHGMSEQTKRKLFEPFYTTREVGKGTGLGLSISYNIIKNHEGEISVQSKIDVGSTFTIKLPIIL